MVQYESGYPLLSMGSSVPSSLDSIMTRWIVFLLGLHAVQGSAVPGFGQVWRGPRGPDVFIGPG